MRLDDAEQVLHRLCRCRKIGRVKLAVATPAEAAVRLEELEHTMRAVTEEVERLIQQFRTVYPPGTSDLYPCRGTPVSASPLRWRISDPLHQRVKLGSERGARFLESQDARTRRTWLTIEALRMRLALIWSTTKYERDRLRVFVDDDSRWQQLARKGRA